MYEVINQIGSRIEHYTYEKEPSYRRFTNNQFKFKGPRNYPDKKTKRERIIRTARSFQRARKTFKNIVLCNLTEHERPALISLTNADQVSIHEAYKRYTSFIIRIKRTLKNPGIRAISVIEFQKNGRPHFHALIWGLPSAIIRNERNTRFIQSQWGYGFIDAVQTNGSERLATYLVKYLTKGQGDQRLVGRKAYTGTRNLRRPSRISSGRNPAAVDFIKKEFGIGVEGDNYLTETYRREYFTQWLGRATLIIYTASSLIYGNKNKGHNLSNGSEQLHGQENGGTEILSDDGSEDRW